MRKIIRGCYSYHGLDINTYIQPDLEDLNELVPLPGDLQITSASSQGIQEKRARSTNTNPQEFTPLALRKPKRQRVQGTFN